MGAALREACEAALPRPKRPSAFYLVAELPLGPTGKVARRRLRELAFDADRVAPEEVRTAS
jgi:acyl-CoA synthetase (AMP-forming)/AMP-acid ligase II